MALRVILYSRSGDLSEVEAALRAADIEFGVWSVESEVPSLREARRATKQSGTAQQRHPERSEPTPNRAACANAVCTNARGAKEETDGNIGSHFDMAISWGGDGTFLDCVRRLGHLPVLGVNSGRLGFLANVPRSQMAEAFAELAAGRYTVSERALLNVSWDNGWATANNGIPAAGVEHATAFNDFVIQRGGTGMISVEAAIDGQPVATYWGDGVIVATPAGSTAYSLSVGGPVVAPGCTCLLLAPIAPHNLTMRPIVVPESSIIELRISTRDRYAYASLDDSRREVPGGTLFRLTAGGLAGTDAAPTHARIVELPGHSFYRTLREKMLWGLDPRVNG